MTNASPDENKQLVINYLKAISGQAKTRELVAAFVSDQHLLTHVQQIEAAFPGYELAGEQIIAERDLVVVRGTFRGVHRGPFRGIQPSGKSVSAGLMIIYRIADGRIAEHWLQFDMFGVVEQLNEVPSAIDA